MISHTEAQELHELLGGLLQTYIDGADNNDPSSFQFGLERALELAAIVVSDTDPDNSPLGDPPEDLAGAWRRYQEGEHVEGYELSKLDEWRDECARDAGF